MTMGCTVATYVVSYMATAAYVVITSTGIRIYESPDVMTVNYEHKAEIGRATKSFYSSRVSLLVMSLVQYYVLAIFSNLFSDECRLQCHSFLCIPQ